MLQAALCALAALLLACGGPGSNSAAASGSSPAPSTPPAATGRRVPPAAALNAPTAAASHQEFKAAGYKCADCHPCGGITTGHGATWMDPASPAFHALAANRSLSDCQTCHGANLDGVGGQTTVGCQSCHGPTWRTSCTMCHGGTDNPTGAPPRATYGNSGDAVRVGAHSAHVAGSPTAQAFACDVCHVVPADALDQGHVDGATATVTFGGLAVQSGATPTAWNRAAPTCSGTYCHGGFKNGNAQNAPDWTQAGQGQAKCGTCHGLPPGGTHPSVPADPTGCAMCHPASVDATGKVLPAPAGKHLDGTVDVAGGHGATWMAPVSPDFHAASANRGLGACQTCHGQDLAGGFTGVSCAQCHGAAWATTCTMCHGGEHEPSGAPPKATWGNSADLVRVGAHTAHVAATASSPGYDCALCHLKPADAFAAGHIDGATATVQLTGLALAAGAAPPAWNRAAPTCASTYCHGGFPNGNAQNAPDWTKVGQGQAACGTCHALPPGGTHPAVASDVTGCAICHPDSVDASGAVKPTSAGGKHLDGAVDVKASHDPSWVDPASTTFHALSANQGLAACQTCHGQDLAGGFAGVACAQCHGASWRTTCTMCHGGTDNATGAPPKTTWGQSGDAVRTGAHTAHVGGSSRAQAYDCSVCHVTPADALSAGHVDGPLATVTFGGVATTGSLVPTWDRASATCASTYCHGATLAGGTNTKPTWTTLDGTQARCGTCHGLPPTSGHVPRTDCGTCHAGYTATTVNAVTHVNGKVDVVAMTCSLCHGDGARVGISGADANVQAAPPVDSKGNAAVTARGVGAHLGHVNQASFRTAPLGCAECHFNAVPPAGDTSHANGAVAFAFGPLARNASWGGVTPSPTWDGTSCASTYCHGAFKNGANATIGWAQDVTLSCTSCHGAPPAGGHPQNTACGNCHAGYTATSVNKATHIDGALEVNAMTCTSCHGKAGQTATAGAPLNAAPPVDTLGAAAGLRVGAHQAHVTGKTYTSGIACQDCHPSVATYTTTHANGVTNVAFTNGTSASFNVGTYTARSGTTAASCASTWCHAVKNVSGSTSGGTLPTPTWSSTISSCTACHGTPPSTGRHTSESAHRVTCSYCHGGTYTSTTVDKTRHVNGVIEVNGSRIRSWNASTRSCQPTCHGSETWDSSSGGSGWGGY